MKNNLIEDLWQVVECQGVTREEIISSSRRRDLVSIRVAMAHLLHFRVGMTQSRIAKILGVADHSTVNHYVNKCKARSDFDYVEMMKAFSQVVEKYEHRAVVKEIKKVWHNHKGGMLDFYPPID